MPHSDYAKTEIANGGTIASLAVWSISMARPKLRPPIKIAVFFAPLDCVKK
jgi:hypothetical protein